MGGKEESHQLGKKWVHDGDSEKHATVNAAEYQTKEWVREREREREKEEAGGGGGGGEEEEENLIIVIHVMFTINDKVI